MPNQVEFYRLSNNYLEFKELDLQILDVINFAPDNIDLDSVFEFSTLNLSMASWWRRPETEFVGEQSEIPDVSLWIDGSLILSPKSHRLLGDLLSKYGEFLPVTVGAEGYFIFNSLTYGEDNLSKCLKSDDGSVTALSFAAESGNLPLFKSRYEGGYHLFCNGLFREVVGSYKLDGLCFSADLVELFE